MDQQTKKVLQQSWEYHLSRNIPIYHSELTIYSWMQEVHFYQLPKMLRCQLHRGTHCDFYVLAQGRYNLGQFKLALKQKLVDPYYVTFLRALYKRNGQRLLKLVRNFKLEYSVARDFFSFYQRCICMLDTTAVASKLVTDQLVELLSGYQNQLEIISYYSRPKTLAPIQQLQKDLQRIYRKKFNLRMAAQRLYQKYAWIPTNFLGEPWGISYFIRQINNFKPQKLVKPVKPREKINSQTRYYLKLLSIITALNEYRKSVFSQANFLLRPFWRELAFKTKLGHWQGIYFLTHQEILDLIKQGKVDNLKGEVRQRKELNVFII